MGSFRLSAPSASCNHSSWVERPDQFAETMSASLSAVHVAPPSKDSYTPKPPAWAEAIPAYAIGSLGAYWTIQRGLMLLEAAL